jgi:hypothetical protein
MFGQCLLRRSLTGATLSRILDRVDQERNIWDEWEALLSAENPDLLGILKLGAQLQAYFAAVERETLKVARATGLTWAQLGAALGTSRQAVWQRATTPDAVPPKHRSGPNPLLDDEKYATHRKMREELAARRDRVAGEMFDSRRGAKLVRQFPVA